MIDRTSEIKLINRISSKSLFLISLALIILNSIFIFILSKRMGVQNLDGTYSEANTTATIITGFMGIIFSFPVLCLFLAFITTIFIDKKQSYGKRYLRGYLFTLLILNSIIVMRLMYNVVAG